MPSQVTTPTSANYEPLRRRGFNGRVPDAKPAEIVSPNTTEDVVEAVKRARSQGWKIGVKSGGHNFFHTNLVEHGMLIDTRNLNKNIEYDPATKIATISPGHTVDDKHIITTVPLTERNREELWELQENFQPSGNGERWNVDSILTDPDVSDDELIEAITPALYDLPSRLSSGTFVPIDYYPDEKDQALSLPQKSYVSSMLGRTRNVTHSWTNFNPKHRMTKVVTDSALKKWLEIRNKWDPSETLIGHRGFASILDRSASHI
ncbi:hypothetical protein LA080_000323 [Diaporthe eres]|nr:hypothetical protein LA080_000323 [Diaporthe eres]